MALTAAILMRIFRISAVMKGSAFAVDIDDAQYLVTARHLVDGLVRGSDSFEAFHSGRTHTLDYDPVGGIPPEIDVAVLRVPYLVKGNLPLVLSTSELELGEDCHIARYPLGIRTVNALDDTGQAWSTPIVQKGSISGVTKPGLYPKWILGIPPTPGFSGGPAVSMRPLNSKGWEARVFGVVAEGYGYVDEGGTEQVAGLTGAWDIHVVLDAIVDST